MMGTALAVALFELGWQWLYGDFGAGEIPLLWLWDNLSLYADSDRRWDPFIAAAWALIPGLTLIERAPYDDLELAPLHGLISAGAVYLVFTEEPGVLVWLMFVPVALVIYSVCEAIDRHQAQHAGYRLPYRLHFSRAIVFTCSYGLGLLLPLALRFGFCEISLVWWAYCLLTFILGLVVFVPIWLIRSAVWLHRRITRLKPAIN